MCYFDVEEEGSGKGAEGGGGGGTAMLPNEALVVMQHIFSQQGVWSSGWSVKIDFLLLRLLRITTRGAGPIFIFRFSFS